MDGECAEGAGKQHSSSSVMVGELMVLLWMVSVQKALGSSIAAVALWLVSVQKALGSSIAAAALWLVS